LHAELIVRLPKRASLARARAAPRAHTIPAYVSHAESCCNTHVYQSCLPQALCAVHSCGHPRSMRTPSARQALGGMLVDGASGTIHTPQNPCAPCVLFPAGSQNVSRTCHLVRCGTHALLMLQVVYSRPFDVLPAVTERCTSRRMSACIWSTRCISSTCSSTPCGCTSYP